MSRLASATAADTGWPANVTPCRNVAVPELNGSIRASLTTIPPSGEYPEVTPLANVMMSGWYPYRSEPK